MNASLSESTASRERVLAVLKQHLSPLNAMSMLRMAEQKSGCQDQITKENLPRLMEALRGALPVFLGNPRVLAACLKNIEAIFFGADIPSAVQSEASQSNAAQNSGQSVPESTRRSTPMGIPVVVVGKPPAVGSAAAESKNGASHAAVKINITNDEDVVYARMEAKQLAANMGFAPDEQMKIATAVSEVCRNIVLYAGRGNLELRKLGPSPVGIEVIASDRGPGIKDLESILAGRYRSRLGMGVGLRGTRNLMDEMTVQTAPGAGTTVRAKRFRR